MGLCLLLRRILHCQVLYVPTNESCLPGADRRKHPCLFDLKAVSFNILSQLFKFGCYFYFLEEMLVSVESDIVKLFDNNVF